MVDLTRLAELNAKRWNNAHLTQNFRVTAFRLIGSKARYEAVEAKTGVPWVLIAVIHERECAQNWGLSIAQGDPWHVVSVHKPSGRGPFASWEAAAIDALTECPPYAAHNKDWSIGAVLTLLERYNGLGYAGRDVPSPYLWSGTDQYSAGKYVRDGFYDPNAVDRQLGCAGLIKTMMAIDPTITFTGVKLVPVQQPPEPTKSLWARLRSKLPFSVA